jgi:D-3-phosphoglycerate dehydrogenase
MIQFDETYFSDWSTIETDKKVLVATLNKQYSYDDVKGFDVIVSCTTGTDHIDNRDIPLLKLEPEDCKDVYSTAEHTMGLMLALLRNTVQSCGDSEENRDKYIGHTLNGKVLGIVGYGRLGKMVAKYAKCFGMIILTHDKADPDQNLEDLLTHSDIVTCHLKLNRDTRHFFSYNEFEMMNGWFINTARGEIVDTEALALALENGNVKGAALDVVEKPELLDTIKSAKMCDMPGSCMAFAVKDGKIQYSDTASVKVIITPHIGGNTIEDRIKTQEIMKRKLVEFLENHQK